MKSVRVIVPAFPPMPSGVGDYALLLAQAIRRAGGPESHFIVTHPSWDGEAELDGFRTTALRRRDPRLLAELLASEDTPVLLQYSGYGYQNRGCPVWLWRGLRQWRRRVNPRLVTMLHEISASGPPWTSSFWLGPLQHWITGRIAYRSDAIVTTRDAFVRQADRFRHHRPPKARRIAVFSNIGEPESVSPIADRQRRLVVFGSPPWRTQAYTFFRDALEEAAKVFGATEIADIGPRCPAAPAAVGGIPVRIHGRLEAEEVLAVMGDSVAGFVCYPADYLAKSGIFASYCASGMVPVTPDRRRQPSDGLHPAREFLMVGTTPLPTDPTQWQSIADAARRWYMDHSQEATARVFLDVLREMGQGHPTAVPVRA